MSLLYGINVVLEALKSTERRVERVCVQRDQRKRRLQQVIELAREKHVPLSFEEKAWLDRKAEGRVHQGVICFVAEVETSTVEAILEQARSPGLLIVLDGIEDPQNLGAILRSAEIAGVDGVFLPQRRSAGLSSAVVKASAGAASHIRVARVPNTAQLVDSLKRSGYWLTGLDTDARVSPWKADFTLPTALVLGNERSGLHRLVKEKCDFLVAIPMRGKTASYNVSVAAGIVLYEVMRQRSSQEQ
jgi:23S rRNA (guanosine2251-2'-O)-methyltransferase